jgi:hypothetical protein
LRQTNQSTRQVHVKRRHPFVFIPVVSDTFAAV